MKEMRLFEVGLKGDTFTTSYEEKVNVAASDAYEAIGKMRRWLLQQSMDWWKSEGLDDLTIQAYVDDIGAPVNMPDDEILATLKYREEAQRIRDEDIERIEKLRLAKVLEIGTLIV